MNFYTANKERKTSRGGNAGKTSSFSYVFLFNAIVILLIIFSAMVYFVTIRAETEILSERKVELSLIINQKKKAIDDLKMKKEQLSEWSHIRKGIKRYKLALDFPNPYQVRKLYRNGEHIAKRKSVIKDTKAASNNRKQNVIKKHGQTG